MSVVYFNQQTGAPHAVYWSKSIFLMQKNLFLSLTEQNKEKKESYTKHAILFELVERLSQFPLLLTANAWGIYRKGFRPRRPAI